MLSISCILRVFRIAHDETVREAVYAALGVVGGLTGVRVVSH